MLSYSCTVCSSVAEANIKVKFIVSSFVSINLGMFHGLCFQKKGRWLRVNYQK